jgi:hypothetical protein
MRVFLAKSRQGKKTWKRTVSCTRGRDSVCVLVRACAHCAQWWRLLLLLWDCSWRPAGLYGHTVNVVGIGRRRRGMHWRSGHELLLWYVQVRQQTLISQLHILQRMHQQHQHRQRHSYVHMGVVMRFGWPLSFNVFLPVRCVERLTSINLGVQAKTKAGCT